MYSRFFIVFFALFLVVAVSAAPVKDLKQFKLRKGDATPVRRDNQVLPSRAVGVQPSLWRRDSAEYPKPSARWAHQA
ncbi:hypothetical protein BD626DRAFT_567659 [Schizophyllum amplum]|uniref:Uncharacterized protein n=1 Tax=Schizophyllum amplum TaxID=97359 RepID=A0A550CJ63_9AGAR|nr:hypothetical protein BD626DRAFT_567659 [Auriculariopsis ampla]